MKYPAKFTTKTKKEILERDRYCIFCWWPIQDFHHIYYSLDSEYTKDRNNTNRWIGCCRDCHSDIHSCKRWEWKRELAINYLKWLS